MKRKVTSFNHQRPFNRIKVLFVLLLTMELIKNLINSPATVFSFGFLLVNAAAVAKQLPENPNVLGNTVIKDEPGVPGRPRVICIRDAHHAPEGTSELIKRFNPTPTPDTNRLFLEGSGMAQSYVLGRLSIEAGLFSRRGWETGSNRELQKKCDKADDGLYSLNQKPYPDACLKLELRDEFVKFCLVARDVFLKRAIDEEKARIVPLNRKEISTFLYGTAHRGTSRPYNQPGKNEENCDVVAGPILDLAGLKDEMAYLFRTDPEFFVSDEDAKKCAKNPHGEL